VAEWGVPDWRIAANYPDPGAASLREWWWEFTRRRPDYRNAWLGAAPTNQWGTRYAADVDGFRLQFGLSVIHDPARQFSDWELLQMRYSALGGRQPEGLQPDALDLYNVRMAAEAAHGIYHYSFDLTRHLKRQMAKAEKLMLSIQAELHPEVRGRRLLTELWPDHLRALDARDTGATYAEIASVLNPKDAESEFWARDRCRAAVRLRDNFPI
jgi:hypothetical protein